MDLRLASEAGAVAHDVEQRLVNPERHADKVDDLVRVNARVVPGVVGGTEEGFAPVRSSTESNPASATLLVEPSALVTSAPGIW